MSDNEKIKIWTKASGKNPKKRLMSLDELAGIAASEGSSQASSAGSSAGSSKGSCGDSFGGSIGDSCGVGAPSGKAGDSGAPPAGGGKKGKKSKKAPMGRGARIACFILAGIFIPLTLLSAALALLTSPLGEGVLTRLAERAVNYAGQPIGLSVRLGKLQGLWDGELRIRNLRVFDPEGQWLSIEEGVLHPRWGTLARGAAAVLQKRRGKDISPALKVDVAPSPTPTRFNPIDYERAMPPDGPGNGSGNGTKENTAGGEAVTVTTASTDSKTAPEAALAGDADAARKASAATDPARAAGAGSTAQPTVAASMVDALLQPEDVTRGKVTVGIALGTLLGVEMPRAPKYKTEEKKAEEGKPAPITILPPWLAIDVGELEIAYFHLGPVGRDVYLTARLHGQLAETKVRLRGSILGEKTATPQRVLPPIQDLPGDVTLSLRELRGEGVERPAAQVAVPRVRPTVQEVNALFSADFDTNTADLRWQLRDSILIPVYFMGIERLWSRTRVKVFVREWPPSPEAPLVLRMASRFGLGITGVTERVKASLFSAQVFWDGQSAIVRDLNLSIPSRDPNLTLSGSAGYDPHNGPGVRFKLKMTDLSMLAKSLGMDVRKNPLGGDVDLSLDSGRGGRYSLWWTSPLNTGAVTSAAFEKPLPGFVLDKSDKAALARGLQNMQAGILGMAEKLQAPPKKEQNNGKKAPPKGPKGTKAEAANAQKPEAQEQAGNCQHPLPHVSDNPTALQILLRVKSSGLILPAGKLEDLNFLLRGTSVDVEKAPAGTVSRTKKTEGTATLPSEKGRTGNGQKGTVIVTAGVAGGGAAKGTAGSTEGGTAGIQAEDSTAATVTAKEDADFTAIGLPRALMGVLSFSATDIFKLGAGHIHSQWLLGGMHGEADIFMAQFDKLAALLPGVQASGDMGFAYALPIERRWPWVDGKLQLNVDNWRTLSRLVDSPLQGDKMDLALTMASQLDEQGVPRQYLKAQLSALRVDAPSFVVRSVQGTAESANVHALADTVALAMAPNSRLLLKENITPPPADFRILDAAVKLGSGSGGPVRWDSGQFSLQVQGESATFAASLRGAIQALMEGSFDFRNRLLQLKRMDLSQRFDTGKGDKNGVLLGMRLREGAQISLAHGVDFSRFHLALLPSGSLELQGGIKTQDTPLPTPAPSPSGSSQHQGGLDSSAASPVSAPPALNAAKDANAANATNAANSARSGSPGKDEGAAQSTASTVDFKAHLRQLPLSLPRDALALLGAPLPAPLNGISGLASFSLAVRGPLQRPEGKGELNLSDMKLAAMNDLPPLELLVQASTLNGGKGQAGDALAVGLSAVFSGLPEARPLTAKATLPLSLGENPGLHPQQEARGEVHFAGAVGPLWRYVPLPGMNLTGFLNLAAEARGKGDQWTVQGKTSLTGGTFEDHVQGLRLTDITVEAALAKEEKAELTLAASDGRGGSVDLKGFLDFKAAGGPSVDARGQIKRLRPLHRDDLSLTLSGQLALVGPLQGPELTGRIVLDQGAYTLLGSFSPSVRSLSDVQTASITGKVPPPEYAKPGTAAPVIKGDTTVPVTAKKTRGQTARGTAQKKAVVGVAETAVAPIGASVPRINIRLESPGQFYIRGKGLDSEWRANLIVEGPMSSPRLLGSLQPVRGNFEFLGRNFRFEKGNIIFNGVTPPNPALDLTLAFQNPQITALIKVLGSAMRPQLDLSSEPLMPRDEIMAQVLFGKQMSSLSRFETLQAANAARQMVDMGPQALDVLATTRDLLGLEVLRLGSSSTQKSRTAPRDASMRGASAAAEEESQTTLEAGKYITDNIYVGVEQGTGDASTAVRVEVELTPNISVSGKTSQQRSGLGVNWKWDY